MVDSELLITIKGSAKDMLDALEQVKDKAGTLENQLALTAGISAAAFAGFTAEIGFATEAFAKQEVATNRLSSALQSQGIYSDALVESYRAQAEAIEQKTGIDAEAIVQGQALFTNMAGQVEITPQLTQAVVDLSAATGRDLNSSFQLVAEAANGHTRQLALMGIQVDVNATKGVRLQQVTDGVSQRFGGSATAAAEGLTGSLGKLHAAFENLQKEIGAEFAPSLEKAVNGLTSFVHYIGEHDEIIRFITDVLAGGAAAAGLALSISTAAIAIQKYREVMSLAQLATEAMTLASRGLFSATGLGLAIVLIAEIYQHWSSIWPKMQADYYSFVDNFTADIKALGAFLLTFLTGGIANFQKAWAQLRDALSKNVAEYNSIVAKGHKDAETETAAHHQVQGAMQKAAAERTEALRKDLESRQQAARAAARAATLAELNGESEEIIALKKKEAEELAKIADNNNASIRGKLQAAYAQTKSDLADAQTLHSQQVSEFYANDLSKSADFQKMSQADQQKFLRANQNALTSSILTEKTAREKALKDELTLQIQTHNQLLMDQQKYGEAFAQFNAALHGEEVQGAKKAFGEMEQMTQSHNDVLKTIGKAASIANITIKTAESAVNVIEGFTAMIPLFGFELGVAAAAAVIAYGGEQIGTVLSAAQGGLVTGGIPGMDSVPMLAMPGELVVPTRNFDEVVNSVSANRGGGTPGRGSDDTPTAYVELSLKDDLMDFIEAKMIKRKRLGISLQGAT